jgi:hypothetical protein
MEESGIYGHDKEVITYLENLADHFDIQVLVTEDIDTLDMEIPPWFGNIIVDEQGCFTIPNVIIDTERFDEWAEDLL